jgi:UDP-N-acetylglucosamine 2-epimerase (non-hydrolysing)
MCPLVLKLKESGLFDVLVCVSGQHTDLLDDVLRVFHVVPDFNLHVMKSKQDLFSLTTCILEGMKPILLEQRPALVLVHGDTTTAFATALACFYLSIPVGHVEAGLRTWNISEPFPEEFNRQAISILSKVDFCPTEIAKNNLLLMKKDPKNIVVTGNTGIDALFYTTQNVGHEPIDDWIGGDKLVLLTAHRRENWTKLPKMLFAIKKAVDQLNGVKMIYPAHPNPFVTSTAHQVFDGDSKVRVVPAMDVLDFHRLLSKSYLVITDSGGIQEEAPYFGIPVLVMRNVTERPEGVSAGTLRLIGDSPETIEKEIINIFFDHQEYQRMSQAKNPFGDGHASERIVSFIRDCYFNEKGTQLEK